MLRSLFLTLILLGFIGTGLSSPFLLSLGYVWVSIVRPQSLTYGFLSMVPVSMIMAVLTIGGYLALDRKYPPKLGATIVLISLLAIWVTITTVFLAVAPEDAWLKWDWAFKTLVFAVFMTMVYRSRTQIEGFLQIFVFSAGAHFIAAGAKTMTGGAGYGRVLGLISENTGFGEGATLATLAIMTIPLIVFLMNNSILMPKLAIVRLGYIGMIVMAVAAAIGSYQRTSVIGLGILAGALWFRSDRKILLALVIGLSAGVTLYFVSDQWLQRMDTIDDPTNEASALGRIMVWRWTIEFALANPFGGGFHAYKINRFLFPSNDPTKEPTVITGKAFHSIYFEMLGEHGWIGLGIFLAIVAISLVNLQKIIRQKNLHVHSQWCVDLAKQLQIALIVLLACGAFIGIAFQPMLPYMFAIIECLRQHVRRVQKSSIEQNRAFRMQFDPVAELRAGAWRRKNGS